jgi:hypothetical protein
MGLGEAISFQSSHVLRSGLDRLVSKFKAALDSNLNVQWADLRCIESNSHAPLAVSISFAALATNWILFIALEMPLSARQAASPYSFCRFFSRVRNGNLILVDTASR